MKRLVAFGCSYTHGQGIDSTTDIDPPSDLAWPSKLAQLTGRVAENRGIPGASNLEILWAVLNFNFRSSDICFIMWSHFNREALFSETGFRALDFHLIGKQERLWMKVHSEYDHNLRSWLNIHHANQHLLSTNLENFHHLFGGDTLDPTTIPKQLPLTNVIDIEFVSIDLGLDGQHGGPRSHQRLAEQVYNKINDRDTL